MINRRDFLKLSAWTSAGLVLPMGARQAFAAPPFVPPVSPVLAKYVDALPIPAKVTQADVASMGIQILPANTHKFHRDLPAANTFGYGVGPTVAAYLGPTIEAQQGTPFSYTATNNLGPHPLASAIDPLLDGVPMPPGSTTPPDALTPRAVVHLHGGYTESASDGGPMDTFLPGTSRTYNYVNDQEAATLWYHDHAMGLTRLNVQAGLAGYYLLRDAYDTGLPDNPAGLPAGYGTYEIPLVLQDRSFNADGTLFFPPAPWVPEFFGDVATVNGKAWPFLDVKQTIYRFRMINGSNARWYNLSLSNGALIYQVGTDGGLLDAPVPLTQLLIAPGERADFLIDFSGALVGDLITLTNNAPVPYPSGKPRARAGGLPLPEIMQFKVVAAAPVAGDGHITAIPATLRGGTGPFGQVQAPAIVRLTQPAGITVRNLVLKEILNAQGMPIVVTLNLVLFDEANNNPALREKPTVNTLERWNIINLTADAHPIHIHLVQFQLLQRRNFNTTRYLKAYTATGPRALQLSGGGTSYLGLTSMPAGYPPLDPTPYLSGPTFPPAANEMGWKDTIQSLPGQVTSLLVPFGPGAAVGVPFGQAHTAAPFTGMYVWHCHILDHEDNDMMLPYELMP